MFRPRASTRCWRLFMRRERMARRFEENFGRRAHAVVARAGTGGSDGEPHRLQPRLRVDACDQPGHMGGGAASRRRHRAALLRRIWTRSIPSISARSRFATAPARAGATIRAEWPGRSRRKDCRSAASTASIHSSVPIRSGLSSSAALECAIAVMFSRARRLGAERRAHRASFASAPRTSTSG